MRRRHRAALAMSHRYLVMEKVIGELRITVGHSKVIKGEKREQIEREEESDQCSTVKIGKLG